MKLLLRLIRGIGIALLALIILVEEWGWRPLSAMLAKLAVLPPIRWAEARIRVLPRHVALMLFLVPGLLLFPVKLMALWLIGQGQRTLGIVVIVLAKLIGTAILGRLFQLTEPQLMSYSWFARGIHWWHDLKQKVRTAVTQSALWQTTRHWLRAIRSRVRSWFVQS